MVFNRKRRRKKKNDLKKTLQIKYKSKLTPNYLILFFIVSIILFCNKNENKIKLAC